MSSLAFWIVQLPGWLLFAYLLGAQCTAAINYSLGVKLGTQEPPERVTEVGVAFWKGYAGADLVLYTPLLGIGLVGHLLEASWTDLVLGAALGITVYWPIACLWTVAAARNTPGWDLANENQYRVVLPLIAFWGSLSLIILLLAL